MDTVLGIKGKDFVMCSADRGSALSIIRLSNTQDKLYEIDGDKLLACAGPDSDRCNFADYVQKNLHLIRHRNQGRPMSVHAAANFARTELAEALRKGPYQVDTLVAGFDKAKAAPEMYIVDALGTMCPSDKAAHGYAGYFLLGLLDREYKKDMSLDEAKALTRRCIEELHKRFLISQAAFLTKVVTKEGIAVVEL